MPNQLRLLDEAPFVVDLAAVYRALDAEAYRGDDGVVITSGPGKMGARIPLASTDGRALPATAYVEIDATITDGALSFVLVTEDMEHSLGTFPHFTPGHEKPIRLPVPDIRDAYWLLIGSSTTQGGAVVRIRSIRLLPAVPET